MTFTTIVVGTDGSSTAREAVRQAAELAAAFKTTIHLVTAYRGPVGGMDTVGTMGPAILTPPLAAASEEQVDHVYSTLEQTASEYRRKGLDVEIHVGEGDAASLIIDVARSQNADLIVVGNKGMTGAKRLLGSVPNTVAHHAPCNLMIVYTTPSKHEQRLEARSD